MSTDACLAAVIISNIPFVFLIVYGAILTVSLIKNFFYGINASCWQSLTLIQKSTLFAACSTFMSISLFSFFQIILLTQRWLLGSNFDTVNKISDIKIINGGIDSRSDDIIWSLVMVFVSLWWISMYLHIILRLIASFQDSAYSISKASIVIYLGSLLFSIIALSIVYILYKTNMMSKYIEQYLQMTLVSPTILCGIHSIYQFNRKLYKIILDKEKEELSTPTSSRSVQVLTEKQLRKLTIATKHTILGNSVAFSMVLFISYWMARNYFVKHSGKDFEPYLWYQTVIESIRMMFMALISYPIFIGFAVNRKYYLCCCKICDNQLKGICNKMALRKLDHHITDYVMSDLNIECTQTQSLQTNDI